MHKPGSIVKIIVTNFVTYSYVEMYPGPNLNMLIGPNGTGKSTIVAAIVLGLGGTPKTIGRGQKVSEYVKHNCEESSITLVLHGPEEGDTFTVQRKFNINDQNTWFLNDVKKSQKEVISYIEQFRIQVTNLCQFLPQDRVADFAKMNKQELLKQTQVALCREDLMQRQLDLMGKRERHKFLLVNLDKMKQTLSEYTSSNLRLEGKIVNFNKKKKYQAKIAHINRKHAWMEYLGVQERKHEVKQQRDDALVVYQQHLESAKPIELKINQCKQEKRNVEEKSNSTRREVKSLENIFRNKTNRVTELKLMVDTLVSRKESEYRAREEIEKELDMHKMRYEQLNKDKLEMRTKYQENAAEARIQTLHGDVRKARQNIATLKDRKLKIIEKKNENTGEIRRMENRVQQLENVKDKRLEVLRKLSEDAYRATLWLRENKHLFRGEVFEPMMLEINILNPAHAVYIETLIAARDKIAFICTMAEDVKLLINELSGKQKLVVNVIKCGDETSLDQYRPAYPIEQLRKFGFQAYVLSLFTAPGPVMKYLCKRTRMHQIPVAFANVDVPLDSIPQEINLFYVGTYRFSFTTSRYTKLKSTKRDAVASDGTISHSIDPVKIQEINGQIHELRMKSEPLDNEVINVEQRIDEVKQQMTLLEENIHQLQADKQKIDNIDGRIQMVKNKMSDLRSRQHSVETIEEEFSGKMKEYIKTLLDVLGEIESAYKGYTKKSIEYELNNITVQRVENKITCLENEAIDVRNLVAAAELELNKLKAAYENVVAETRNILRNAKGLSAGFTPNDDGFNQFREEFDALPEDLERLDAEKDMLVSKMDCLNNAADDEEITEYENRVRSINTLEGDIAKQNDELEDIIGNMDRLQEEWLEPLLKLIGDINERFSSAFKRMGCAGEVVLHKAENEKDYEHYGLSIRVTYRNGEPLQELNATTQSGGERAVATAAFMLALQELTPVPFRCVDEINQGMDANNERRIFELLVDATSHPDTAQYFFITPKLIPHLTYGPTMKIHIVHNGPFLCNPTKWNTIV